MQIPLERMSSVKRLTDFGWAFEGYFDFKVTHQTNARVKPTKMSLLNTAAPAILTLGTLGKEMQRKRKTEIIFQSQLAS